MRCPFCSVENTKVIDSRLSPEGNKVRRRRECESCEKRFTTYEVIEDSLPMVIKGDGRRETFNIEKVRAGIHRAIEKRPVSAESVEQMINEIEAQLRGSAEKEIPSSLIGEYIMEALKKIDQVAYVRFASVYRAFQDVHEFQEEIEKLLQKQTKA